MDILKVVLTTLLSAASLFVIAKVIGHKQISQLDVYDYINGITLGSIAAELATELEEPLKPFVAMIVYGLVAFLLSVIASKFQRSRKFLNGSPTIIMSDGKIYRKNMKKAKLELSEFMVMCRQEGYFNLNDIHTAVFEYNGKLTILPKSEKRPLNPSDVGLAPEEENISTELIMDGRILEANLKRMGLDLTWLKKQLSSEGVGSAKDVFLAVCDSNNKLTVFRRDD